MCLTVPYFTQLTLAAYGPMTDDMMFINGESDILTIRNYLMMMC